MSPRPRWRSWRKGRLPGLVVALLPLLALDSPERTAPTSWALLVGVTDYVHFGDEEGGDLPGAEQDARRMRDVLVSREYVPEANVRLLLNGEATRDGIEEAITGWLTDRAAPGDNVVVFFAGHGSQMWDENGDETDGLDETLAPADVLPDRTDNDISDDVFGTWLDGIPTENVVVILDSCNSGTGTRDVTPFSRARSLGRDLGDIPEPEGGARTRAAGERPGAEPSGFEAGDRPVLELAAAQPDQAAVEVFFPGDDGAEPFQGGAFTTHLIRELWRASEGDTYEQVFRRTTEAMKRDRFQQDPRLSEDVDLKDRVLFDVDAGSPAARESGLPVLRVSGTRAEIGGGAALGLSPGSVFETPSGARLTVVSSGERATVAEVAEGTVDEGDRARLIAYRYPDRPLLVSVAALGTDVAGALSHALEDEADIRAVEDPDGFSHLFVRRSGERLRVIGADGFVRHDDLSGEPETLDALVAALRKEAASKRLGDMENPARPFDVRLAMSDDRFAFGLGEEIRFRLRSERDGYLTLIDLGTDGTVAMLLPNADAPSVRVRAGEEIVYPADEDVYFEALPPAGSGLVRAFVTDRPLDVTIPEGETYAYGDERFAATVVEALRDAVGTSGSGVALGSWNTASLTYRIRP